MLMTMENQQSNIPSNIDEVVKNAASSPSEEEKRHLLLQEMLTECTVDVYDDIPPDVNTICIGGRPTFAFAGIHFVKAKQKQGKTSALAVMLGTYVGKSGEWGMLKRISPTPLKVCYVDTEQKRYDSQQFKKQVLKIANSTNEEVGDNLRVINIRRIMDYQLKKELIEELLVTHLPEILVIDGIVDLNADFNDVNESKELMSWLMYLADEFNIALFCVLHTNKNAMDHNMRGHIGTMAEQKCDTTTECEKDDKSSIVTVKCACSRHRPYPDWSFTWDEDGNLIDAEEHRTALIQEAVEAHKAERERKKQELSENRQKAMETIVQKHGGSITRSELTELLETQLKLSRQSVSPLISGWIKNGILYENGKLVQLTPQTELFGYGNIMIM